MLLKISTLVVLIMMPLLSNAYVSCTNVPVSAVESAYGPGFHGFNNGGAKGATVFMIVDTSKCQTHNQEDISNGAYLVIDHYGEAGFGIHDYWASMLIAASSMHKTISFHARVGGVNNVNAAVLMPYFLRLNN